jgi:Tol biopolymer transport system component
VADKSRVIEPLTEGEYRHFPSSWTPGGEILAYFEMNPDTGFDIWLLDVKDGGEPRPLIQTPAQEGCPEFSPDGRWLAYASDESGQPEVYVQSFPEAGEKYQMSTDGGASPLWSKNGKELFYRIDDQLLAVDIETDGKRFLMVGQEPFPDAPITQLHVVLNWFES